MIVFVPAYDEATQSNFNLAQTFKFPSNFIILLEKQATRDNLLDFLKETDSPLFAMSHGDTNILRAQDSQIALSIDDAFILEKRSAYIFACHTAVELGESVAKQGGIWWGYSDAINCYVDEPFSLQLFADTFLLIYENFPQAQTQAEVQDLLEKIRQQCEEIQDQLNYQFYDNLAEDISISQMFGVITTFIHIWQRLRVWLPGLNQPEKHSHAPPPILPWR